METGANRSKESREFADKVAEAKARDAVSSERMMKWFRYEHLTNEEMRSVSSRFHALAVEVVTCIPPGPERTVALRKLLEAKDAAVRAVIEGNEVRRTTP